MTAGLWPAVQPQLDLGSSTWPARRSCPAQGWPSRQAWRQSAPKQALNRLRQRLEPQTCRQALPLIFSNDLHLLDACT